jgi:hypothetical protein
MRLRSRLLLVPLALFVGWLIRQLTEGKSITLQTASFVLGGMAVLALYGIALGFKSAKATEARRRAKENIWFNH